MYPQFGDARYPAEFGPGQTQLPMDPSVAAGRYGYPGYYPPKVPEGGHFGGMSMVPRVGHVYGGKPRAMVAHESMYGQGWDSFMQAQAQAYMGHSGSKQSLEKAGYPYPGQPPDIYSRGLPMPQGYPEAMAVHGMPGYPPGYGSSLQYHGQYPYGPPQNITVSGGMAVAPVMDGYGESMRASGPGGMGGGMSPYPPPGGGGSWPGGGRPVVPPGMPRGWSGQEMPGQPGTWAYRSSDGYPSGGPSTPGGQQQTQPPQPQQAPSQPQTPQPVSSVGAGTASQMYRQQSQQSVGVMSPQTPYSSSELQKQPSVSSLRDALLGPTPSSVSQAPQYSSYSSPRVPAPVPEMMNQSSPMTPSTNLPHTPDASTPLGSSSILSPPLKPPSYGVRQDSQLSESELLQSFSEQGSEAPGALQDGSVGPPPTRVSPFQVEKILGIKNDKPVDSMDDSSQPQAFNRMPLSAGSQTPPTDAQSPFGEHLDGSKGGRGVDGKSMKGGRSDSISTVESPSLDRNSQAEVEDASRMTKAQKGPPLSPVDRSHPSIMAQYNLSDDASRKEFLDALFAHLEKEGIPLIRLPTVCKAPLDLYQVYTSVQQLGGFMSVTDKRQWREVLRSLSSFTATPNSGAVRMLQHCYMKMLLPYECHMKSINFSELLVRIDNSRYGGLAVPASQSPGDKMNHTEDDSSKLDDALESLMDVKVNGEAQDKHVDGRLRQRMKSQDSASGSLPVNNQEDSQLSRAIADGGQKQGDDLDIPEGSQNSVETYSQGMSGIEHLPDISVQEAESVLGEDFSTSSYPGPPSQPTGGPGTPTVQNVPSPSTYPAQYPQQNSHGRPEWAGPPPDMVPPGSAECMPVLGDVSDPGMMGAPPPPPMPPNPPSYPPSYHMDPAAGFRPSSHPSAMHRGYPYNTPSQPDMHPGHNMMMQSPYPVSATYPGMSPSMPVARQMDGSPYVSGPYQHRPVMMPQPGQMMRRVEELPPYGPHNMGLPPPPGPDWAAWQQHRVRFSPHLASPMSYERHMRQQQHQQFVSSQRPATPQQAAALSAQLQAHHRASPGGNRPGAVLEGIKIHWQDQMRAAQVAKMIEKSSPKPSQSGRAEPSVHPNKSTSSRSTHYMMMESLKRPLPDWNGCVEGTKPHLVKRRRLFSGDCGHVEPWRVMMSLKSGLLSESTWAVDTLNILLHDERTVGYFYLKHHHSLLNTLVDHFRKVLAAIFGKEFDGICKYVPGCEGEKPAAAKGRKEGEDFTQEWLGKAAMMDYDLHQKSVARNKGNGGRNGNGHARNGNGHMRNGKNGNGNRKGNGNGKNNGREKVVEERDEEDVEERSSAVPLVCVFDSSGLKLGKTDHLAHIQIPSADDHLLFPKKDGGPEIMGTEERLELERQARLCRVDATPVADLLQREVLVSQIPLNRFGRLSRSPRRRVKSFLEDEQLIDEMSIGGGGEGGPVFAQEEIASVAQRNRGTTGVQGPSLDKRKGTEANNVESKPKESDSNASSPDVLREESEIHRKESLPLWSVSPSKEHMQARCVCLSNILRSLSFIPGNDLEFSQHPGILVILGQLLMLHHEHLIRPKDQRQPSVVGEGSNDRESKLPAVEEHKARGDYWWWDCLEILRENTLVILSNISGQLDLSIFPETISFPIMNGLLHWSVCPSAQAVDPLPDSALVFSLSPQRLVLEALAKMSISEGNVDLILATPPLTRLDLLFSRLVEFLGQKKHPVVRQFALVLLSNLAQGNEATSRLIGQQKMVVSLLLECIESSEHASCASGGQLVGGYNPEDPNSLSVAMLRRAATTLHCLAKVPANRTAFLPFRDRTLYLVTSQYVEHSVSSVLMDMLFELGKL